MNIEQRLDEVNRRIHELEKRIMKLEGDSAQAKPKSKAKPISINEFMQHQNTSSDVQNILAVGYYLEKYEGISPFNAKDLSDAYRRLKIPKSGTINFNYKVIRNIQQGYMTESSEKKDKQKAWVLTVSGESFVASGFQKT